MSDTTTLMITLPADEALAAQLEQRLARHAEVMRQSPQVLMLETIALIASIAATSAAAAASVAAIRASQASVAQTRVETLKTLLEIKQLLAAQGHADQVKIGTPAIPARSLADADESFLKTLLALDE